MSMFNCSKQNEMASRRPAPVDDHNDVTSSKRPRLEDEGDDQLYLRGGSGQLPTTSVVTPSDTQKPLTPATLGKPAFLNSPNQNPGPNTPGNQTNQSPGTEDPQPVHIRTSRVLAVARTSKYCTLKVTDKNGQDAIEDVVLILKLRVHTCTVPFETRLGYSADIFLRRHGPDGRRYDQNIGEIGGWRVSKPSRSQPRIDPMYWVQEWLRTPLQKFPEDPVWTELACALHVLYTQAGTPRTLVSPQLRANLDNDASDLVFVQLLRIMWIDDNGTQVSTSSRLVYPIPHPEAGKCWLALICITLQIQGNGFGRMALEMYYRLLTSRILPAWYAVPTPATFLLVPALPDGEGAARWESDAVKEEDVNTPAFFDWVEDTLSKIYSGWGYHVYIRHGNVLDGGYDITFTVMGRTFNYPEAPSPVDRLRRVRNYLLEDKDRSHVSSAVSTPMHHRRAPATVASSSDNEDDFSKHLSQGTAGGAGAGTGSD